MALAIGTRFGPYEVRAPLGNGGMGGVYRARNTALSRPSSCLTASPTTTMEVVLNWFGELKRLARAR